MNTQINISIPGHWKESLEKIARIESVKRNKTMSYLDLIRDTIMEKFNLTDEEGE